MAQNYPDSAFDRATPVGRARALLIGAAPPQNSHGARHLARLLHMLSASDHAVGVMSMGPGAVLGEIEFTSDELVTQSLESIEAAQADLVFLYPAALNFGDSRASGWMARRREELSRLGFAFALGRRANRLELVCESLTHRFRTQAGVILAASLGALSKGRSLKLGWRTARMATLGGGAIADTVMAPDTCLAERSFFTELGALDCDPSASRLTPQISTHAIELARQAIGNAPKTGFLDDVQLLTATARLFPADHLAVVRSLRRQSAMGLHEMTGPPVSRAYGQANRLAPEGAEHALPFSRFMEHVRSALKLEDRFPLRSRSEVASFVNWYREKGPQRACGGILPEPLPALNAHPEPRARYDPSANWGRLGEISALDARPFPVPPQFLTAPDCLPGSGRFDLEEPQARIAWAFEQIILRACEGSSLDDLGRDVLDYMAKPLGGRPGNPSRFVYLMALQCRRCFRNGREFLAPWHSGETHAWFCSLVLNRWPVLSPFLRDAARPVERAHRVDLVGLTGSKTGISVNFEMSRTALSGTGLPIDARDAEAGYARIGTQAASAQTALRRSVALYHMNADRVPQALVAPIFAARAGLYNIGFLLWEFSQLPDAHRLALEMLDEIWVPSRFLQDAYSAATDRPVTLVGKGLNLPEVPRKSMRAFGLRDAARTYLTCFDLHSSVERKNPLAAVRAFQAAFPSKREDVQLIVKTTKRIGKHWGDPENQLREISKLALADRRIHLVSDFMDWGEFLSLIRSVDCLISAHRAEGFGYIPAYALHYGVPVVNTNYSGVRDYCTKETALPVPYKLIDVPKHHAIYPMKHAQWADVWVDALADAIRKVADEPMEAILRARTGQELMRTQYSIAALRRRYLKRLAEIGAIAETDLHICS